MKQTLDANRCAMPARGIVEKILTAQRQKLFDAFLLFRQGPATDTILNVGIKSDALPARANHLAWNAWQDRTRITLHEIEPAAIRLPFRDGEFDWVFCAEVIEHAGDEDRQFQLMKKLYRVARKGVFLTTSNRKHPLEFNTGLPLLHWLPRVWWRRILAWTGKSRSAPHLLDGPALYRLAGMLPGKPEHDVGHKRVFGIKAHFFLMIRKENT